MAVIDVEQQAQPVALARYLLLQSAGIFVVERVVDRRRHLAGYQLGDLELRRPVSVHLRGAEV